MKKNILYFGFTLAVLAVMFSLISWTPVMASTAANMQTQLQAAAEEGAGYSSPQDPRLTAALIIRSLLGLVGIVLVALMLYAGFLWMTAGGNEDKVSQAKKLITNAVIGLAIILSAYSLTFLLTYFAVGGKENMLNEQVDNNFNPFD